MGPSKNRRQRAAALLCGLLLAAPCPAWAGAWTVPRNRWYAEHYWRYYHSKKTFDERRDSSRRAKTAMFSDIRNELKLEYGLADGINLLASVPYQSAHYRDDNVDLLNTGVGDIYVRGKFRLMREPVVSSLQLSWKIPSAYDPNVSPGLGDGQVDFETRLQVSRAWLFPPATAVAPPQAGGRDEALRQAVPGTAVATAHQRVAFVNAETGITWRNEESANEVPFVFEAGMTPLRRLMLIGSWESVTSIRSTSEAGEDFGKWGLRAVVNVWGDGFVSVFREGGPTVNLEVGYTDIATGRNTADAYELFGKVAIFY